jgi:hypothetical protein
MYGKPHMWVLLFHVAGNCDEFWQFFKTREFITKISFFQNCLQNGENLPGQKKSDL